ncbi:prophage pi3 protein 14 [Leuconostoc kimchii IMSNU 11154]|uniref:Prophage pi3 protein 14 n=1 Tax=Leuconostoc kimchii (strain IMSNU 11154 / KCTC 2386 / IH25) TaxID=762051 RepID=D5T0U3_LEUKI|nr:phage tail tape measure protein [Leuconostoc kimchii]ADG39892.1 prophage pi3 protein 14 [Leuconostoc kimchii IMSNU 11154]
MVERIQAEMATAIALDTLKATNSLRGLGNAVTSVKNAWKAQEAAAKSSGDYLKASQERYQGLGREMDAQKNKISELQQRQKGLDTTTKEGAESFLKYEKNIQQANQRLASLESQQQRAKSSMEYQTSGLAKLQQEYKQMNAVSGSYVDRLKAEGKERQANISHANSLKSSLSNLSQQYVKQEDELKRIAAESGTTNEVYRKQSVRVNETATSVAKMKNEFKSAQREVNNANPYGFGRFSSGANAAYRAADKMGNGFHAATQKAKELARSSGLLAVGIGAVSIKGAQTAADLQESYIKTLNLATTGGEKAAEAQKNVNQMQKDGSKYSVEYGKSQKDIADGYQELIKRGYTSAEALGAMRSELQASVASGDDFNDVLSVTSQVVDAYGMRTDNAAKMTKNTKDVVNQLAYAADMTATDFQSLGKGMEYVGDSAHSAGYALSETSSAMGILSNHGLEADKAGTGLRKVINSLTSAISDQDAAQRGQTAAVEGYNSKIAEHKKKIEEIAAAEKDGTKSKKASASATKTQQDAIDKLESKVQAVKSGGTGDMLSSLGISKSQLVDSNGNLVSLTKQMEVINEATKHMGTAQKNSVFNSLFGTTGQQAGIILAQNNKELDELNGKVKKSADGQGYVANLATKNMASVKAELSQFKMAGEAAMIMLGKKMLPVLADTAVSMTKAFDSKAGQHGLEVIAGGIAKVSDALLNMIKFIGTHTTEVKIFASIFAGIWAFKKISDTIGWIKTAIGTYRELNGVLKTTAALNAAGIGGGKASVTKTAANVGGEVATDVGLSRVAGAGGALKTTSIASKVLPIAGKVTGILGAAVAGWDVGSSVVTAFKSKKADDAYKAGGKTAGTVIGGGIGAVLGSVIPGAGTAAGAMLGAGIGDALGSTKVAQSITEKLSNAFKKHPIKVPKIDVKDAYKDLDKANKKYYDDKAKRDKKDVDLLYKNGYLTKVEYDKRLKDIQDEAKKSGNIEKLSQSDRTALTKYYAQKRTSLEEKAAKDKRTVGNKWDKIIGEDAAKYGDTSLQVQRDYKKKEQAVAQVDKDKKKAINKLTIKDATQTTIAEAKLHTTLTGKIQLSSNQQNKILSDLVKKKGKLSDSELKKAYSNSKKEYDAVKGFADKQYKSTTETAEKKFKNISKAANNQFNSVSDAAKKEAQNTIDSANRQFKGNSQYAKEQRAEVTKQANKKRDDTIQAAKDQRDGTIDKARDERNKVSNAATDKYNSTVKSARKQRDDVKKAAEDQKKGVTKSSDETHSHVKSGSSSFWETFKKIVVGGLGNSFGPIGVGVKAINALVSKFGGSKQTITPPPTKFASGTGLFSKIRKPITSPIMAMLNDGNDSPQTGNREMLIHPNGKPELVQGTNVIRPLLPGTEVLNATETAMMLGQQKISRFASGTGFFADVWDSIKDSTKRFTEMFSFITDAVAHPIDSMAKTFNPKRNRDNGDVFNALEDHVFDKPVKEQAKPWWSTLWGMAKDAGDDSASNSALLSKMIKLGNGKPYVWGATGPDGYDCSGLVQAALDELGKSFPHYSGDQYNSSTAVSNPSSGDLVFFGEGGSQHVGVYGGNGRMYSAQSPQSNPNIGWANVSDWSEKLAASPYRRVPGMKTDDSSNKQESGLNKLVRSQVGGMFDWIKKFIAPLQDSGGSEPAGDGVGRWRGDVVKALGQVGLSTSSSMVNKVLRQIQTESGGNASAMGGNDGLADGNATGLMQVKPGTFRAYAAAGHTNIMNGYDNILAGLNYAKNRYGNDLSFLGQGHGYANGTITNVPHVANIAEGGMTEAVIPWDLSKKSRAMELLGETVTHFAQNTPSVSSNNSNQSNSNDSEVISKLEGKFDQMIGFLSQLVSQGNNPTQGYAVLDRSDLYRKQASDGNLRDYQAF